MEVTGPLFTHDEIPDYSISVVLEGTCGGSSTLGIVNTSLGRFSRRMLDRHLLFGLDPVSATVQAVQRPVFLSGMAVETSPSRG